ncbi:MAG: hypothetical protein L6V88_10470 [Anaerotruncus sp.]|nr:MAG: hypothetical protein L6V88_10470 [Anaerotruncus sp.]
MRRPQITYDDLKTIDITRPRLPKRVFEQVEISVKYEGYIARQERQIKEMRRIESKKIPENLDYSQLKGLRLEAVEKAFPKIKPQKFGAGRQNKRRQPRRCGSVKHNIRFNGVIASRRCLR